MVKMADDGDGIMLREGPTDRKPDGLAQRVDRGPRREGPIWQERRPTRQRERERTERHHRNASASSIVSETIGGRGRRRATKERAK